MVFYARSLATGFGSSHCSRIRSDGSQSSDCASNSSHACLKTMTTAPIVLPRSHPGQHCEQILLKSSGPAPSHRTRPPAKRRNDHPSSGTGPSRRKRRDLIRLYRLQFGYGVPVATDGDIDPRRLDLGSCPIVELPNRRGLPANIFEHDRSRQQPLCGARPLWIDIGGSSTFCRVPDEISSGVGLEGHQPRPFCGTATSH